MTQDINQNTMTIDMESLKVFEGIVIPVLSFFFLVLSETAETENNKTYRNSESNRLNINNYTRFFSATLYMVTE